MGCITRAFSGSSTWGEIKWRINRGLLGFPRRGGIKVAASPLPSKTPQRWEESKLLHHPGLLGVPNMVSNQSGIRTVPFLESPTSGGIKVATVPLPSRGPKLGEKADCLQKRGLLGVPK